MKTDAGRITRLVHRLLGSAPSLIVATPSLLVATVVLFATLLLVVAAAATAVGSEPILMAPFRW